MPQLILNIDRCQSSQEGDVVHILRHRSLAYLFAIALFVVCCLACPLPKVYGLEYVPPGGSLTISGGSHHESVQCLVGNSFGLPATVTVDGVGSTWTIYDGSEPVHGKYIDVAILHGSINVVNGGSVRGEGALCIRVGDGYGTALLNVRGAGSRWYHECDLDVHNGGMVKITDGGYVHNYLAAIGHYNTALTNASASIIVNGASSIWDAWGASTYINGDGKLSITGGGKVNVGGNLWNDGLLEIDIGQGSLMQFSPAYSRSFQNDGIVRMMAGARPSAHEIYTPISATASTTWSGGGVFQGIGGKWNSTSHQFTVSSVQKDDVIEGNVGINLKNTQRVLIDDDKGIDPTGWTIGVSFLESATDKTLDLTATAIADSAPSGLGEGETVLGAWNFVFASGYAEGDAALLSFLVGSGYSSDNFRVWRRSGDTWSSFDAVDLSYDGQYANFSVTGFSGYAITGVMVPEPGTLALLLAAGMTLVTLRSRKRIMR